jgi:hypothetical protein
VRVGELRVAAKLTHFVVPLLNLGDLIERPLHDSLAEQHHLDPAARKRARER